MGMQINTNTTANNALRNLNNTQNDISKSMEKLSSGLRINRAADDAAGLSIAEGLKSQVGGLGVAQRNAQDAISVLQTAEGGLTEAHSILQRVRDLAVQSGNDSNNVDSRAAIAKEADQLGDELVRIGASSNFNGNKLLDGSAGTNMSFQVGAGGDATADTISIDLTGANLTTIGNAVKGLATAGFADKTAALATVNTIDTNIKTVSQQRSSIGATQNRLESASKSLAVSKENLTAAESRIRDTDMAGEMVKFTRSNILSQAGTAMLSQANQSGQGVLKLLG
jgi:flagellin